MSKTNYMLLCMVVVLLTTLINLSQRSTPGRGWSSGSGWSIPWLRKGPGARGQGLVDQ